MISQQKIQEIQVLEQNLQSLLLQKQAFQLELNETDSALNALEKADDEVYKITGNILVKSNKEDLKKDLADKKKLLELRLSSIERQEKQVNEKIDEIRLEILKKPSKTK